MMNDKSHVNLKPPEQFNFEGNIAEAWKRWYRKFNHYLTAIEAQDKKDEVKVGILLSVLGEDAQDKYETFGLSAEEKKVYATVIKAFEDFCIPKKNETVARFKFFQRKQTKGESFDDFITDLKKLSVDCAFETLKDSLIKDQIVSGIHDEQVKDRLLREDNLTLESCAHLCKVAELAKQRITTLRGTEEEKINIVQQRNRTQAATNNMRAVTQPWTPKPSTSGGSMISPQQGQQYGSQQRPTCSKCGNNHGYRNCPAYGPLSGHLLPAAAASGLGPKDEAVQELEHLKAPQDDVKTISVTKTDSITMTDENGHKTNHHEVQETVSANGEVVAHAARHEHEAQVPGQPPHGNSRTELDVPSEGVHRVVAHDDGQKEITKVYHGAARLVQPSSEAGAPPQQTITGNGNRRSFNADIGMELNNNMDHYSAYSGVQHSPLDMAEYIFWTGDERGVTMAIEEFLQDGLMTKDEAIGFLQEIKFNIDYLQAHYAQQRMKGLTDEKARQERIKALQLQQIDLSKDLFAPQNQYEMSAYSSPQMQAYPFKSNADILKAITNKNLDLNNNVMANVPSLPISAQDLIKRNLQDHMLQTNIISTSDYDRDPMPMVTEEEYEELIEKLKAADSLYTEYSLEEVIYQLAKMMFTQSLSHGSGEAQYAIQRFTTFLELEAEKGRISRNIEKKVLDVLILALSDTLADHPELSTTAQETLSSSVLLPPGNRLLRQILEMGTADQSLSKAGILAAYKEELAKAQANQKVPSFMDRN